MPGRPGCSEFLTAPGVSLFARAHLMVSDGTELYKACTLPCFDDSGIKISGKHIGSPGAFWIQSAQGLRSGTGSRQGTLQESFRLVRGGKGRGSEYILGAAG